MDQENIDMIFIEVTILQVPLNQYLLADDLCRQLREGSYQ